MAKEPTNEKVLIEEQLFSSFIEILNTFFAIMADQKSHDVYILNSLTTIYSYLKYGASSELLKKKYYEDKNLISMSQFLLFFESYKVK